MAPGETIEVRLAVLQLRADGIVEIRFKPGLTTDVAGVQEVVTARRRICGSGPRRVMVVLAPDVDFELGTTTTDTAPMVADRTVAEATVATTALNEKLARMYYDYIRHPFPTSVHTSEAEAVAWLLQQT
ncbi:MAG: hypothetical protein IT228_14620 [Flavobacteriales bacterium]|nr:hypothetical protein [Flavobacteriales bacterium]MCC6578572.1 hypothetical protein [Flavobacteriales bacterium]NUQ15824.1 hypothetical protein [Flavobacteriales bacterium]